MNESQRAAVAARFIWQWLRRLERTRRLCDRGLSHVEGHGRLYLANSSESGLPVTCVVYEQLLRCGVFLGASLVGEDAIPPMLTDTAIRAARSRAKPYKLSDGGGLYLLMKPIGTRLWRLKYRSRRARDGHPG
jgi:hypothetical protein